MATQKIFELFEPLIQKNLISGYVTSGKLPKIPKKIVSKLLKEAKSNFRKTKSVIRMPLKSIVIGDIHGNLCDLVRIFRLFNSDKLHNIYNNFVFLGDYVDRGTESVEVMCLLLALYIANPTRVVLLRGNHEFACINKVYGFYEEIMAKYRSEKLWKLFNEVFNFLPLVCILGEKIFCVHGGICSELNSVDQIQNVKLPIKNYLSSALVRNLVWSDPGSSTMKGFQCNDARGFGQLFGTDTVKRFLTNNNLKLIIRAHQCNIPGTVAFADYMGVTVFSSSDYDDDNKCGVITIKDSGEFNFYSLGNPKETTARPSARMMIAGSGKIGLEKYSH
ncbi:Serine/threonine-protein phosphatase beta isoform [Tritrichomonas foetus]|uniref:Serine/threonine-protein phosphatase n=1 Tax=Tritrichomonas foetus TaxID=1144522 RepID=A0A1J4KPC5_9EUKA|nr:Serine/threonine-protein phosphatase beta isoform [Tritrichomonas foetus]|eukprot:OHT11558.1 Serine/threonine-protein phosphatase beta isoform [Tritrichomonas foetus]